MGRNGVRENNKLRPEDRAVHNWYRFVLSFPPHLVRDYLERFGITKDHCVLDPFCGTGTTLVECKKLAIPSVGIEANPMPYLASQVKLNWGIDPDRLVDHARGVASRVQQKLSKDGIAGFEGLPLLSTNQPENQNLRSLAPELTKLLLKDSISPIPLHKTLLVLEALAEDRADGYDQHERLALAKTIVHTASNLRFGPEVGVGTPKTDAPVVEAWLGAVAEMAEDLRVLRSKQDTASLVHHADARSLGSLLPDSSVSAVITSPPYPNEKDYTRTTRLESVLLGLVSNKKELRALKKTLIRSNTRSVYKEDEDDTLVANHAEIQRIAQAIERRRVELGKTSGWERLYPRVTKLYFGGMARHLSDIRRILQPGAKLAYVVGDQASYLRVMIRTGRLLADIAQSLGYEVAGIDLFRTRRATATRGELREEVIVLRWPGATGQRNGLT